jgi:protein-tyrosine-phosphatase
MCRSPIAEGFVNFHGQGKVVAASAGTFPLPNILEMLGVNMAAIKVMQEVGISIGAHKPRYYKKVYIPSYDILVNMSSTSRYVLLKNSSFSGKYFEWRITDPLGRGLSRFRKVRDEIQTKVFDLIETT